MNDLLTANIHAHATCTYTLHVQCTLHVHYKYTHATCTMYTTCTLQVVTSQNHPVPVSRSPKNVLYFIAHKFDAVYNNNNNALLVYRFTV